MENAKKVTMILDLIEASNAEIARIAGVDPSLVSKYRNESRQPSATSKSFERICDAIASCAIEKKRWNKLAGICNFSDTVSPGTSVLKYIIQSNDDSFHDKSNTDNQHIAYSSVSFGEKLKLMVNVLDLSNVMLAKALNVDTSLISRMKSGERIPKRNTDLVENMCSYFLKRIKTLGLPCETLKLFSIPIESLDESDGELVKKLSDWMLVSNISATFRAVDGFIKDIEQKTPPMIASFLKPVSDPNTTAFTIDENSKNKTYFGCNGLLNAVIALLSKVAVSKKTHTIKIYSDQNLDWFTNANPGLMQTLSLLGYHIILKKNRFQIIHNIDRNVDEMILSLDKWLPFYKTGLTEGYYCPTPSSSRFSHNMIVVPGIAAIFSSHIIGTENTGVYFYHEAPENISFFEEQFEALLKLSKPIVQVYNKQSVDQHMLTHYKMSCHKGCAKKFIASPSLQTMPSPLFNRLINRAVSLTLDEKQKCRDRHDLLQKQFDQYLNHSCIIEYIYFPRPEEFAAGLVNANLSELLIDENLPYFFEEFSEHVSSLITLLSNPNYHLIPLSKAPLGSTRIVLKEPTDTLIYFNSSFVMHLTHPLMYQNVNEYIDAISLHCLTQLQTKDEIIKFLKRYIK